MEEGLPNNPGVISALHNSRRRPSHFVGYVKDTPIPALCMGLGDK